MTTSRSKTAVLLLAMGGPGSLDEVRGYLVRVFSDRSLIRLPGGPGLQKPLAHVIARLRAPRVKNRYRQIGGGSPLLHWTQAQAEALQRRLNTTFPDIECFVGMRYHRPFIADAVARAVAAGVKRLICLPMYPQYCRATTGSSFAELQRLISDYPDLSVEYIRDFHDHPEYIGLLRKYIASFSAPEDHLVFSAHAVPQRFVTEGDPYVEQVHRTAELAAGTRPYTVAFQSRTGPVRWVGPDTVSVMRKLLSRADTTVAVIPVSFVCDHIETLYDLDIELPHTLGESAATRWRRIPMFNDDERFADALANIVARRLVPYEGA
jgi:ferrochelatase